MGKGPSLGTAGSAQKPGFSCAPLRFPAPTGTARSNCGCSWGISPTLRSGCNVGAGGLSQEPSLSHGFPSSSVSGVGFNFMVFYSAVKHPLTWGVLPLPGQGVRWVLPQPPLWICGAWLRTVCVAKGATWSPPPSFLGGLFPQECALGADPSVPCSWVAQPQRPQALAQPATTNDDVSEMALVPWGGMRGSGCGRKVCGDTFSLVYQLWGCLPSP